GRTTITKTAFPRPHIPQLHERRPCPRRQRLPEHDARPAQRSGDIPQPCRHGDIAYRTRINVSKPIRGAANSTARTIHPEGPAVDGCISRATGHAHRPDILPHPARGQGSARRLRRGTYLRGVGTDTTLIYRGYPVIISNAIAY